MTATVHGTAVRIGAQGVLIRGPSGSGKSDLALRLMDQPGFGLGDDVLRAHLVADDRVHLRSHLGCIIASAPQALFGLIEVRGSGLMRVDAVREVPLALVVDLVETTVERLPEPEALSTELLDVALPLLKLRGFEASAPARIRAFLNQLPVAPERA